MSQQLSYIDLDKRIAYKDALERKEELMIQKYGYCDQELLETRHELKYDVSYALTIPKQEGHKIDKLLGLYYHPTNTWQDRESIVTYCYNFFSKCYNDQTITDYSILPEPCQKPLRAFDRVVNVGLRRTAELITGKSNRYFTHYAWGEGTAKVLPKDTKLQLEVKRIDLNLHGFSEPRGSEIAFFGRSLENVPTAPVNESGIFDSDLPSATMFLRTVYGGATLTHNFNLDQVVLMHLVYQLSV